MFLLGWNQVFLSVRWTGHRLDPWQVVLDRLWNVSHRGGQPGRDPSQGAAVAEHGKASSHCTAPHRGVGAQTHTHTDSQQMASDVYTILSGHVPVVVRLQSRDSSLASQWCPQASICVEQVFHKGSSSRACFPLWLHVLRRQERVLDEAPEKFEARKLFRLIRSLICMG